VEAVALHGDGLVVWTLPAGGVIVWTWPAVGVNNCDAADGMFVVHADLE